MHSGNTRYVAAVLFFVFAVFIGSFAGAQETPKSEAFKKRAHEINEALDKFSIVRPESSSLSELISCRAQAMLDPRKIYLTQKDVSDLSAMKCYEAFCTGDVAPMASMLEKTKARAQKFVEYLKKLEPETLSLDEDKTIPGTTVWETPAKDDAELRERWRRLIQYYAVYDLLREDVSATDAKAIAAIKRSVIAKSIKENEEQIALWDSMTVQSKEELFVNARVSCADKYGRVISNRAISETGSVRGQTFSEVTNGMMLLSLPGGTVISQVVPDSPADRSRKLKQGDLVQSIKVGDRVFDFTKKEEFEAYFQIPRKDGQAFEITVKKANGEIETVPLEETETLGYSSLVRNSLRKIGGKTFQVIGIPQFVGPYDAKGEHVPTERQVQRILGRVDDSDAIVLDLRNNPGGSVQGALLTAGAFLPDNTPILTHLGRLEGKDVSGVETAGADIPNEKPLFVLINQSSASASEILAKALQSSGRAVLIGETSFGKGIQQFGHRLKNGDALFTTNLVREGADRQPFHLNGVKPDLFIPSYAGTESKQRETQPIKQSPQRDIADPVPPGKDYWKRDTGKVAEVQKWIDGVASKAENVKAYYAALETLRKIKSAKEIPLSLEKARALRQELDRAHTVVEQMGGFDSTANFDSPQMATWFALDAAANYLRSIEKKAEKK